MWGGTRGAGQRDECFRVLDLNAPVAAFAPLGRIGRVRAKPGVPLTALACPGLGALAPLGRTLNAGLATLDFRWGVSDGFARNRGALAALACPGLGAFAPLGRALNAGLAALGFRCGNIAYSVFTSNVRTPQILWLFACHCFRLFVSLQHT